MAAGSARVGAARDPRVTEIRRHTPESMPERESENNYKMLRGAGVTSVTVCCLVCVESGPKRVNLLDRPRARDNTHR